MNRCSMKVVCNVFSLVVLLLISGCDEKGATRPGRNYSGELLGKKYEVDILDDTTNLQWVIDSVFAPIERIFNSSNPQSLINGINAFQRMDTVYDFIDSTRLFGIVYDLSLDLCRNTQRGWDPATAPLKRHLLLSGGNTPVSDSLLEACSFNEFNIRMQEHVDDNGVYSYTSILKRNLLTELDFSDIASALAVDYLAEALVLHGAKAFRIKHDKDVKCYGLKGHELATLPLGMSSGPDNPNVDIGNMAYASRDGKDKLSIVDAETGFFSSGPIVYTAVAAPQLTDARIYSHAFMVKDLNSIADYYTINPDSKLQSFIFFQRGDTLQNASTNGFDQLIVSSKAKE